MQPKQLKGFTLVELLVAITVIAIVLVITVLIFNPVEYLRRGRDSQRLMDYTLINQAVNFYSYGAAVSAQDPDLDGPNYTNSCVGQENQGLFVSVPDDGKESSPTPPSGWTYYRASSTPLREISGTGWLPIDFHTINENLRPLHILPVDPINTFADGFYYTYTCGSFELNLRFESTVYKDLASTDGGDDPSVYETGSVLTTAPYQNTYHPTGGGGGNATGTLVLYPNTTGFYSQLAVVPTSTVGWDAIDDPIGSPNTSDYVLATTTARAATFGLTNTSQTGTINKIRMSWRAKRGTWPADISPRIRVSSNNYDAASSSPNPASYTLITNVGTWTVNPNTGSPWTWTEINNLEAGAVSVGTYSAAIAYIAQLYVEVDYTTP